MAKRDPNKTARNRIIANLKSELRVLLPSVLKDTRYPSEASLNATIGSKHDDFFDLKHDVIPNHEAFVNYWFKGFKETAQKPGGSCAHMYDLLQRSIPFRTYTLKFLKRSYLKHYEELSRLRPDVADAVLWIGLNNATYGLLITPRFKNGQWENDKSEIRAFQQQYWTIGHVMETGLVIPGVERRFTFSDIDQYLLFFCDSLVRSTGSKHQMAIAEHYCNFVKQQSVPEHVPLLIPEYRYGGLQHDHEYRLDFLTIDPFTMNKVGFELSPWSTHGYLSKTRGLTQKKINAMAQDNFENEMERHRAFFRQRGIWCLIYTDKMLEDKKKLFDEEFAPYLTSENTQTKIDFEIMEEFFHV